MKKYLLISILFLGFTAQAQYSQVVLSVSGKGGYISGSSFGRLAKSYNEQNATNLTKLKNFGLGYGWSFNVDLIAKGIYMGYYFHNLHSYASSKITNYLTREFSLAQNSMGMDFGGGSMNSNGGYIIYFGIYYSTANLTAGFKYRDNYSSLGKESAYNGIYHGFGLGGSLGAKVFKFSGPLGITAGLRWSPMFGISDMVDYGKGSVFANETLSEGWTINSGKNLKANFQAILLELGLAYQLNL